MSFSLVRKFGNGKNFRVLTEGAWVALGQIASLLGALMLVRVLTDRMSPNEYGLLALALTIGGLASTTIFGGIPNGISRYYSVASDSDALPAYYKGSALLVSRITIGIVFVTLISVIILYMNGLGEWAAIVAIVQLYTLIGGYNAILGGVQNAARRRAIASLHIGGDAWLKVGVVTLIAAILDKTAITIVLGYALSAMVILVSHVLFLKKELPPIAVDAAESKEWVDKIWNFSWPFATWGVFGWLQQSSARWALESFETTAEVGVYAVLSQLGISPIQVAVGMVLTVVTPVIFSRAGDAKQVERISEATRITKVLSSVGIALTIVAALITMLTHEYIFKLFVGPQYLYDSGNLVVLVLSGGIFGVAQVIATMIQALLLTKYMVVLGVTVSIFGFVASFIGVYWAGLEGVVWAQFAFSSAYLLANLWLVSSKMRTYKYD